MKFSNLSRRLSDYTSRGTITQEDALSLISVLCDDIRFESGVPVDRCQVRDAEQLVDELYALSYTINTLYQSHKSMIQSLGESEEDGQMWEQLREAQAACDAVRSQNQQQDVKLKQLKDREAELYALRNAAQDKEAQTALYKTKVAQLEQELELLRHTELQPLTERFAALEKEQAQKEALLRQLQQELGQKEQEMTALRTTLQTCQNSAAALEEERAGLQQKLEELHVGAESSTQQITQLRQQLQEAENANGTMTMEFVQVRAQLEAQQADNEAFRTENLVKAQQQLNEAKAQAQQMNQTLLDFTGEREAIGAQIAQAGTLIAAKQMDLDNKKQQLAERNGELEHLNDQLSAITADLKPLLDEINMRKEQLDGMDREQIESGLRKNLEIWQAQIQELEQKQRECLDLQEEITRKTSLVASERDRWENLTAQKRQQDEAYSALCQDVETVNAQLEELKNPEYLQRLEKLQRQQGILQQLRTNLEQGNRNIGCGWSFHLRQDLDQRLTASAQSLKDLQKAIQDYTTLWQTNLNQ